MVVVVLTGVRLAYVKLLYSDSALPSLASLLLCTVKRTLQSYSTNQDRQSHIKLANVVVFSNMQGYGQQMALISADCGLINNFVLMSLYRPVHVYIIFIYMPGSPQASQRIF